MTLPRFADFDGTFLLMTVVGSGAVQQVRLDMGDSAGYLLIVRLMLAGMVR